MNRILSIFAFFRHGSAVLFRRNPLILIRTCAPNPTQEQDHELERSSKTLLHLPVRTVTAKRISRSKLRMAPLTLRWELAESADGKKFLRMKWDVAKAGVAPAFAHLETA